MNEKQVPIFEEIFKNLEGVIDSGEDVDGLQVIGAILTMPDESYEIIKPALLDSIEKTFNDPDARFALAHMMNTNGISIEDLENNLDVFIQALEEMTGKEDIDISESKKDLLKFIYTSFLNSMNESKLVAHRVIQIPIELCNPDAKLPTYATDGSAAMDIYSPAEYTIKPGEVITIPVGFKVDIPRGYALLIQPRSGMSLKTKIRIPNTPGLIDSDYHEEIKVIVENIDAPIKEVGIITLTDGSIEDGNLYGSSYTIGKGERFAQMRLIEVPVVNWLQVKSIGDFQSDHGEGFGSTGMK